MFVKEGSILPLAAVTAYTDDPASWELNGRGYGSGQLTTTVFEEDGSYRPALNPVTITWQAGEEHGRIERTGSLQQTRYAVKSWKRV
jgi:hypothetical protein